MASGNTFYCHHLSVCVVSLFNLENEGAVKVTTHRIIHGDVRKGLRKLPDKSIHLSVTSPPYYQLRDYEEDGQIGMEETPEQYIQTMVEVSREVWRVLRDDGTYFINIGDSYAGSGKGPTGENGIGNQETRQGFSNRKTTVPVGMKEKDLLGIPWMLAEALRADGWYWRKWFPWIKRSAMPESVDDRPASSLEIIHMFAKSGTTQYWTHPKHNAVRIKPEPDYLFKNRETGELTSIEPENWKTLRCTEDKRMRLWIRTNLWTGHDYFWDPDAIRVTQSINTHSRGSGSCKKVAEDGSGIKTNTSFKQSTLEKEVPGGRNRRDSDWFFESWEELALKNLLNAWQGLLLDEAGDPIGMIVNPEQFDEKHFATFPCGLVKPLVLAGTSESGCCPACGAPYIRIIEKGDPLEEQKRKSGADANGGYQGISWKHEKLLHGKSGHFHNKEKKQDSLGKQTYTGFNERWQQNASDVKRRILEGMRERIIHWVPSCDCNAGDPVPCMVLDPFAGRGTVTRVARDNGRSSAGCELSEEYIKIMKRWLGVNQAELQTGIAVATYSFEEADE